MGARWFSDSKHSDGRLGRMLDAARDTRPERLGAEVRARIVTESLKPGPAEGLAPLFVPARRLLVAGGLPLILAAAFLVVIDPDSQPALDPATHAARATRVAVSKDGGNVLFSIQNGNRAHRVYRSSEPQGEGQKVELSGGAYVEDLQDRDALVFYRIE